MGKKKLLMTASTFPRWEGDTEPRFILDLAKAVNKYYDVTVLAPAAIGAKDTEVLEGVHVIRYHYLPFRKWETLCYPGAIVPRIKEKKIRALEVPFLFLALWTTLLRLKSRYDVIHAHWLIPQGIIQGFVGGNYVITSHGTDLTSLNNGLIKKMKKRCVDRAKAVTVVSERLKQIMMDIYHVPEQKISVLSMGCDTSSFSPRLRNESFFGDGRKHILFVGRLVEVKGVSYLIDAMKSVDADLYIVGSGPDKAKLEEQVHRDALDDKVHFLGARTHNQLAEIYASADVCVFPSIKASDGTVEGFGLVIIEAMASGVPVVASKSGGIVDIIEDGVNGLFAEQKNSADLAEKINRILADPELRAGLSHGGLETARRYSYDVIARRHADIYDRVIK